MARSNLYKTRLNTIKQKRNVSSKHGQNSEYRRQVLSQSQIDLLAQPFQVIFLNKIQLEFWHE